MTHMQNTCRRQENTHAKQNSTCHNFPGPPKFPEAFLHGNHHAKWYITPCNVQLTTMITLSPGNLTPSDSGSLSCANLSSHGANEFWAHWALALNM